MSKDILKRLDKYLNESNNRKVTAEIDVTFDSDDSNYKKDVADFIVAGKKENLKVSMVKSSGPGGGWPVFHVTGPYDDVFKFLKKKFDTSLDKEDFEAFI